MKFKIVKSEDITLESKNFEIDVDGKTIFVWDKDSDGYIDESIMLEIKELDELIEALQMIKQLTE